MEMFPLRVYLDSSDFSVLSDHPCGRGEFAHVLQQLREWVADEKITCWFSGTHLSEMAPKDACFSDAAERRANLLVELCGRNCFIPQDRLFKGELRFALNLTEHPPIVHSSTGTWYPEFEDIFPIVPPGISTNSIKDIIKTSGVNRKDRRSAERRAFKHGKPRSKLRAEAILSARTGAMDEILEKYPMRPQDARVINRYAVGDASAVEATAAFEESLRDPSWMMRWFSMHHEKLSPVIEWTRGPAVMLVASINEMASHAASARKIDTALGTSFAETFFSSSRWMELQNDMLLNLATRLAKEFYNQEPDGLTVASIDERGPGWSVGIRSLYSAWWTVTRCMPRKAKLSDFPDALHAMYAPYVDVFRADSFMAPHIEKHVQRYQTRIVHKLPALISTIKAALDAHAGEV